MLQHYAKNLGDRAVAYLNVDLAFEGNISLRARALPILRDFVYDVAKRVISIVVSSSTHAHTHILTNSVRFTSLKHKSASYHKRTVHPTLQSI